MNINSQHQNLLGNKISPKSEDFVFWWPFWIQIGRHSKPTIDINSQHHHLLGNQISPKSEDFCIWRPFCTLVTMAMAAILNFFNPQKLPQTTVDIPTKWIIIWLPNHGYQFPTSKSTWKPNFAQIGGFLYFGGHFGFKMAAIANQRCISIRNIIIYLETKLRPNRRIFCIWWPFCTLVTMATAAILNKLKIR